MKLRVLLASSSLLAKPLLNALNSDARVEMLGLLSTPDRPKGRHGTPTPNELVSDLAGTGIEIWRPKDQREIFELVRQQTPDLVIVIAYGKLIKAEAISLVRHGWINLHFSLLPAYRGAAPVQRSLLQGDEVFGLTFFKIDEGLDTGPIYLQEKVDFPDDLPATDILGELSKRASHRLADLISMIINGNEPTVQQGDASLAPKIEKNELALNLLANGDEMFKQIRAFTRKPGVWFLYAGKRCIITSGQKSSIAVEPGRIAFHEGRALLGAGRSSIEIVSMVPEGKREMSGPDWIRGMRFVDGESRNVSTGL